MRIMTRKEESVLDMLMKYAGGDPLLVERAIRECSATSEAASLSDIVEYIKQARESAASEQHTSLQHAAR